MPAGEGSTFGPHAIYLKDNVTSELFDDNDELKTTTSYACMMKQLF
jgi:hypothetical protein